MGRKPKARESLEALLQSTSLALFPEQDGRARVSIDSVDVCGDTPLHVLLQRGNDYGCRVLIEAGAEVNAVGDLGYTPLHVAVMKGNEDMIALLLAAGARSDLPCEFGETAVAMAERNDPALARALKRPSVQRSG